MTLSVVGTRGLLYGIRNFSLYDGLDLISGTLFVLILSTLLGTGVRYLLRHVWPKFKRDPVKFLRETSHFLRVEVYERMMRLEEISGQDASKIVETWAKTVFEFLVEGVQRDIANLVGSDDQTAESSSPSNDESETFFVLHNGSSLSVLDDSDLTEEVKKKKKTILIHNVDTEDSSEQHPSISESSSADDSTADRQTNASECDCTECDTESSKEETADSCPSTDPSSSATAEESTGKTSSAISCDDDSTADIIEQIRQFIPGAEVKVVELK